MTKKLLLLLLLSILGIIGIAGCSSPDKIEQIYKDLIQDTKNDVLPVLTYEEAEKNMESTNNNSKINQTSTYDKIRWDSAMTGIEQPAGVLCRENDIVVVDNKRDMLVILDYDGKYIQNIGKTGNGKLEFLSPTDITELNHKIYIIDSGNNRIQVMNDNLEYCGEIPIESKGTSETIYESIAVDSEGIIYLAGNSLFDRNILQCGNEKNKNIGDNFYGAVGGLGGDVYAINQGLICIDLSEMIMSITRGNNYIFDINNGELKVNAELQKGLIINAFVMTKERIICSSINAAALLSFDYDGNDMETVASFDELQGISMRNYLDVNNRDEIVFTNPDTSDIFYLKHK